MAAANNKKKVRTRRRERKNIEKGQVHISSSFNNTMVTCTEKRHFLGFRRRTRFPWQQEIHSFRRADRGGDGRKGCNGAWSEDG